MLLIIGRSGHTGDDAEDRAESVVHAVNGVRHPAPAATMPALALQDRVEHTLHALLHGRFAQAAGFNLLAALCTPVVVVGLLEEARIRLTGRPRRRTLLYRPWLGWGTLGLALLFAVLRNLPGPLGAWLAP